jgi:fatty-acyl-CoA synthase
MAFITDMAAKRAEISPHKTAFTDVETARSYSFAEINALAEGATAGFGAMGLVPGDRIAILCHNRVEFFIALFACQKGGFILTPLNWRQPVTELAPLLALAQPKCLLHDPIFTATATLLAAPTAIPRLSIGAAVGSADRAARFEDFGTASPVSGRRIDGAAPWYLLYTSGTTGLPKAVIQTGGMAWANALNIGQAIDLIAADVSINFLPLFHTAGVNLYTLPVFLAGGMSYVLRKFDAEAAFALLEGGSVTQFFGVPAIYQAFSQHPRIAQADLTRLRAWGCGGAPLPAPLVEFFASRGALIRNGMGMTETGPTVFLQDVGSVQSHIGSVGKAQMLVEVRVEGEGDTGQLLIRGPGVTPGYFGNPDATQQAFTADGWLKTGDVARCDSQGNYYIIDRIKDMYISGGENVYPAEVERLLYTHPAVQEVAVVGVPDARWGETGAAFIVPKPGVPLDVDSLGRWCRARIAAYKVPKHIRLVEDFPRTAAGKVRKHELGGMIHDGA